MWGVTKTLTVGLSQDAYGLYAILVSIGSQVGSLSASFFTNGIWRYVETHRIKDRSDIVNGLLRTAVATAVILDSLFFAISSLISIIFGFTIINIPIEVYWWTMPFVGAFAISQSISLLLIALSHGDQDTRLIFVTFFVSGFVNLLTALFGVAISEDALVIFCIISVSLLFTGCAIFILSQRGSQSYIVGTQEIREVVTFSAPLTVRNFIVTSVSVALLIVALNYGGFNFSAIISIGFSTLILLSTIIQYLFAAYRQFAVATYEQLQNDRSNALEVFKTSLPVFSLLVLGAFWLYELSPYIVIFLSTPDYIEAANFVKLTIPGIVFLWFGNIYGAICNYLSGKVSLEMISSIVGFIAMVICVIWLVPVLGLAGVAYSYLAFCFVSGALSLISGNLVSERILQVRGLLKFIATLVLFGLTYWILSKIISNQIVIAIIATIVFLTIQIRLGLISWKYLGFKSPLPQGEK